MIRAAMLCCLLAGCFGDTSIVSTTPIKNPCLIVSSGGRRKPTNVTKNGQPVGVGDQGLLDATSDEPSVHGEIAETIRMRHAALGLGALISPLYYATLGTGVASSHAHAANQPPPTHRLSPIAPGVLGSTLAISIVGSFLLATHSAHRQAQAIVNYNEWAQAAGCGGERPSAREENVGD